MKKIIFTFLFCTLSFWSGFTQNQGEAIYRIKPVTNLDSIFSDIKGDNKIMMINSQKKLNDFIKTQTFKLKFKNGISHFKMEDRLESDNEIANFKFFNSIYPENYYNHLKKTNFYIIKGFNRNGYLVMNSANDLNIVLKDDSYNKIINGYNCSLAIMSFSSENSTYDYKVWYSKEINVPYGPSIYNGLPGLVVQVKEPSGTLFELKSLNFSKQNDIIVNETLVKITEEEFNKIVKESLGKFKPN